MGVDVIPQPTNSMQPNDKHKRRRKKSFNEYENMRVQFADINKGAESDLKIYVLKNNSLLKQRLIINKKAMIIELNNNMLYNLDMLWMYGSNFDKHLPTAIFTVFDIILYDISLDCVFFCVVFLMVGVLFDGG